MLPVILRLGPITIYSYGVSLFLAFFFGLFVIWKRGREANFDEEALFDLVLFSSLWALIGARIVYILFNLERFGSQIFSWLNIFGKPGLNPWGALAAGLLGVWWFARPKKWPFLEIADVLVVGVALAQIIGWIGSFLNGSGYGLPTKLPIGINFPGLFDRRHPAQLYAAALYLLLFWWLWWVEGHYRTFEWYKGSRTEAKAGFLFFSYLIGSGLIGLFLVFVTPGSYYWGSLDVRILFSAVLVSLGLVGGYFNSGQRLNLKSLLTSFSKKTKRSSKPKVKPPPQQVIEELGNDII